MKIASKENNSHNLSIQLLQFYSEEMEVDSSYLQDLKNHLVYRNEVYFKYALADVFLLEGKVDSANATLSAISMEIELTD